MAKPRVTFSFPEDSIRRPDVGLMVCRDCGTKWTAAGVQGEHGRHQWRDVVVNCVGVVLEGGR